MQLQQQNKIPELFFSGFIFMISFCKKFEKNQVIEFGSKMYLMEDTNFLEMFLAKLIKLPVVYQNWDFLKAM